MMLEDRLVEERRGGLLLSTDRAKVRMDEVLAMLHASHWGGGMTMEALRRAVDNSLTMGVYDGERQVGFLRAVTDISTYAYLTDVIVHESARGQGIGKWMMEVVMRHPDLQGLRRMALWTRSARGLYEQFGFSTDMPASTYMEFRPRR
jgi:GNAT superfamily N-acetyltransferase